jgi:ElaB/YqjD/DUF883 family membrane-anchored ribosome-binding protein
MGGKVKSIIHEATAEVHSNMLKFGENEPDKVEEICTAAQTKAETLEKQLEEYIRGDPINAILIAAGVGLGVGLLVGLLVRR